MLHKDIDRVLHINSYYGQGRFYKNLYDAMVQKGMLFSVFTSIPWDKRSIDFDYGEYTQVCKNYVSLDRIFFYPKQRKILADLKKRYAVKEFDLCHSHSLFTNGWIAWKVKQEFHIPYVVAVRVTDVDVFFRYMIHLRFIGIRILQEASRIIFISENTKEALFRRYIPEKEKQELLRKSVVVPNGLNPFWLGNRGEIKSYKRGDRVQCLQVSTLQRQKNIQGTIKAIQWLRKQGMDISLTVVGEMKNPMIQEKICGHSWIEYYPHMDKEDLIEIYRRSTVFVMPSFSETFGLVYLEAMSQGVPVVYSAGEGFDSYFKDGVVGYRVDAHSSKDIARGILRVLDQCGVLSRNCILEVENFRWEDIADQYKALYESVGDTNIERDNEIEG